MEDFLIKAHSAQDAAEALIALGWPAEPHGPGMDQWRLGDLIWTDEELMGLATQQDALRTMRRPKSAATASMLDKSPAVIDRTRIA